LKRADKNVVVFHEPRIAEIRVPRHRQELVYVVTLQTGIGCTQVMHAAAETRIAFDEGVEKQPTHIDAKIS
jgi:hypothetical protein